MTRKFLRDLGLEESAINDILDEFHRTDTSSEDKNLASDLAKAKQELDSLKEELVTAQTTIKSLERVSKDNEEYQSKINDYKNQIKQIQEQAQKDRIKNSTLFALKNAGCIDSELVISLIDLSKVSETDDGKVIGVAEQIEALKQDEVRSIYFKSPEPQETPKPDYNPDRGGYDPMAELNNSIPDSTPSTTNGLDIAQLAIDNTPKMDTGSAESFWSKR